MVVGKIFNNKIDEEVHSDFVRFSRGEFKDKYLIEAKKQASKTQIKTSAEFTNTVVKICLKNSPKTIDIRGVVVSTNDLEEEIGLPIKKKSNFQGVKKLQIETEASPGKLLELMEKYPKVFFAISFKTDDIDLKIKPKAPMSGKPGKSKEDGPKIDFCTLKTNNQKIIDEILFDIGDFRQLRINHTINITDIVYPNNMDELTPKEIRAQSKRKGIITRIVKIDDKEKISEKEFIA